MLYSASQYRLLPQGPGVYLFLNGNKEVIYVGKAKDLKKRVASYFINKKILGEKTTLLLFQIKKIKTIRVDSEIESLLLESNLIKKYNPKFNVKLTDGKAYPLIRITKKYKYPAVLSARRPDDKYSIYFGPYPNAGAMRLVLRTIRRIFPYQSVINHPNKPCLYNHLGLCPCPTVFGNGEYKKNIKYIVQFLNGNTKKMLKQLKKERDAASLKQHFEISKNIQKKIDAIEIITSPFYKPFEYELNPNLYSDLRTEELNLLKKVLNKASVAVKNLKRIECYDISNISGKMAVGSMVVFVNGEQEKSMYRRFKIRFENSGKPNDVAGMQEIIERRLNHGEWPTPDLIIVDGGKGQITAAKKAFLKKNITVPVVGLAKREETIITENFDLINLPKNSSSLHLLMRIRDEAHRFTISYHKHLRKKALYG